MIHAMGWIASTGASEAGNFAAVGVTACSDLQHSGLGLASPGAFVGSGFPLWQHECSSCAAAVFAISPSAQ